MNKITNIKIFDGKKIIPCGTVLFEDGKIKDILEFYAPMDEDTFDGNGLLLAPGFVDIHVHGGAGCDVMDKNIEGLKEMSAHLAKNGTTSFLATTVTFDLEETNKSLKCVEIAKENNNGADILGVHLEGPFLNIEKKGAQNGKYIINPSIEAYEKIADGLEYLIKRVTIAPELSGSMDFIKYLSEKGVCVSIGHTCADFDTFEEGIDNGACLCTHLFNGMNPFHHRNPGVVGASLYDDRANVELICDLIHLDKNTIKTVHKIKGADKCCLISDAMCASGLEDGQYALGGLDVFVKEGSARLEDGTLAGSIITMKDAVKNLITKLNLPVEDVLNMASYNPAKLVGAEEKGKIAKGFDADFVLLDDNFDVCQVFIGGKKI